MVGQNDHANAKRIAELEQVVQAQSEDIKNLYEIIYKIKMENDELQFIY